MLRTAKTARPSRAQSPSVRSGLQPRQNIAPSATAVMANATGAPAESTGMPQRRGPAPLLAVGRAGGQDPRVQGEWPGVDLARALEEVVQGEENGEVRDHADYSGGDARQ